MNFSLDQLNAFTSAARLGSFSAAARHLGKAHSAVSTAVANLEIDLGVVLFDRSSKHPVLTAEGTVLLREAENILANCQTLVDRASIVGGHIETSISWMVDELIPQELIVSALQKFEEKFPDTEITLRFGSMGDVADAITNKTIDAGLCMPLSYPGKTCECSLVGHMPFHLFAATHHPLASVQNITLEELKKHKQLVAISRKNGTESKAAILGNKIWMLDNSHIIRELVIQGQGWAILPEHLMEDALKKKLVAKLATHLTDTSYVCPIYLIWNKGRQLGAANSWLLKELNSTVKG